MGFFAYKNLLFKEAFTINKNGERQRIFVLDEQQNAEWFEVLPSSFVDYSGNNWIFYNKNPEFPRNISKSIYSDLDFFFKFHSQAWNISGLEDLQKKNIVFSIGELSKLEKNHCISSVLE